LVSYPSAHGLPGTLPPVSDAIRGTHLGAETDRAATAASESPGRGGAIAVRAHGLTKRFGSVEAVRSVSFALPERGVCGLLGPNGAGKTTTIRMIAGVLLPDAGTLEVAGYDASQQGARMRAAVGYLPESAPLYPELTVREHMRFRASLRGLAGRAARHAIDEAMSRTDVARFADRCAGTLSKGMQQRAGLAQTLLGDPRVLILDEPSVGLDPGQTLAFRALVRELGQSRLVLLSSHLLSEVEDVCTELVLFARGRLVAHEPIERFRDRAGGGRAFRLECDRSVLGIAALAEFARFTSERAIAERESATTGAWFAAEGELREGASRSDFARILRSEGVAVRVFESTDARLEEIFVSLVAADAAGDPR
ncbi:MAG: ABC transporter ATP-binding protein, partial [bacterium]